MLFNTACTVEHTSTTNVEVEVTQGEENAESFLNLYDGEITYSYFE